MWLLVARRSKNKVDDNFPKQAENNAEQSKSGGAFDGC